MEALYKKISTAAIILFALGMVAVSYQLYTISSRITETLGIHESTRLAQVNRIFQQTNWVVSAEVALGLLAIVMLLMSRQNSTQVVSSASQTDRVNSSFADINDFTPSTETTGRVQTVAGLLQNPSSEAKTVLESVLLQVCRELEACQGAFFRVVEQEQKRLLELSASYAYYFAESQTITYEFGEGLTGQVAKDGRLVNIKSVPEGYLTIISGLGKSSPKHLVIAPVKLEEKVIGVMEIASFREVTASDERYLDEITRLISGYLTAQSPVVN